MINGCKPTKVQRSKPYRLTRGSRRSSYGQQIQAVRQTKRAKIIRNEKEIISSSMMWRRKKSGRHRSRHRSRCSRRKERGNSDLGRRSSISSHDKINDDEKEE